MDKLGHRKASKTIKLMNASGTPISNAKVSIKQTSSDFLFGVGGFDAVGLVGSETEEQKKVFRERVDRITDVFNYVTLPVYWGLYEQEEGKTNKDMIMRAAKLMIQNGVTVKGHPLCWHTVCADWLLKYEDETILEKQLGRIDREVSDFKGVIDIWDVINEVVIMPEFDKYDNAVTRLCKRYGRVDLVKKVFDEAVKTNENGIFLLNDFNTSSKYEQLIEDCLDAGIRIDAIGIQSHQHQGYWGKEKLLDVLERFSRFKLPIHFTENTLLSGTPVPAYIEDLNDWQVKEWPSTDELEECQKIEMEEMYRTMFENPYVQGFTCWDLADGGWLNAPSGLIREDNTTKPVYDMLKALITKEWRTEYEGCTDDNGFVEISGFTGSYEIVVENVKSTFELKSDDTPLIITI